MIKVAEKNRDEFKAMDTLEKKADATSYRAKGGYYTLFHALLASDLPEDEKRPKRMAHEGFEILLAGSDTTARTMGIAVYHLLANKEIALRLRAELETVMPNPQDIVELRTLEALPWLVSSQIPRTRGGDHRRY